jgi:hemerythrin-like domain-containing protein
MTLALTIIRDEHRALASVLKGLQYLVEQIGSRQQTPDFALMKAMVDYIEQFPDRLHHPKEDLHLFPVLRQRDPAAAAALDELEEQHRVGPDFIGRVKQALRDFEADRGALDAFEKALTGYADFQWAHMSKEEKEILPLAEKALQPDDWVQIDAAFKSNNDPLVGVDRQKEFRELFRRVVNLMPAPMGLGPERR